MSKTLRIAGKRAFSAFLSGATALSLVASTFVPVAAHAALTQTQVDSIISLLQSFGADATTINNVRVSLTGGTPSTGGNNGGSSSAVRCTFTRSLFVGAASGADVECLQRYLNDAGFTVSASGAGSPGNETSFFGSLTRDAVARWQAANGVSPAVGYFGPLSQAKYNELIANVGDGGDDGDNGDDGDDNGTPTPAGSGLTVTAGSQPAAGIAPGGAARVPFTRFSLTASSDGDVNVDSIVVGRHGAVSNSSFAGVLLLDEDGLQIGDSKTLNSNNQATLSRDFTIPAGQTRMFTLAGNIASLPNNGEVGGLSLVSIQTDAQVNANLPIQGVRHTFNNTLSIGRVSMSRGSLSPGANRTSEEVGTTGLNFTSIKVTAGSAEDVAIKSVRFEQTGSASASDLANVMVLVDGNEYTPSVDGDFYSVVFPGDGIIIPEGFSEDVTIKGDIVAGSAKTVDFDVDEQSDLYLVGQTYGYGILPPFANSAASADSGNFNNSDNPYYDAFQVTISAGNVSVSVDTTTSASNIAVNELDQVIAGFEVDIDGEAVTFDSLAFNFETVGAAISDLENVKLVDGNGNTLAGPQDGSGSGTGGTITFTDSVTFPEGITNIKLLAKLSTDFVSNDTVAASTTPSSDWSGGEGEISGDSITASPSSAITGPDMTVRAADLDVTTASQPFAQTVIAGADQFEFAQYIFDASQSGEDIRITSIPLEYNFAGGASTGDLSNCTLYDGGTAVTTGSNRVDPSVATGNDETFIFDGTGIVIPKATSKTLSLKCDVSKSVQADETFTWALNASSDGSSYTGATGLVSGTVLTGTTFSGDGQQMTAATSGSYTVTEDTSLLYRIVEAGSTNVTLAKFRFEASINEAVDIKQVALELGNTASNAPSDLLGQEVTLWHDGVQVGKAQFGQASPDNATSTLSSPIRVAAGEFETIEVRGDLSSHNANSPTGAFGAFLAITYDGDNNGLNGNYATGVSSSVTIDGTSSDVTTNGARVFRTIPTFEDVTDTTSLAEAADLYKIKVTAGSDRDISLRALSFDIATTGVTATSWQLFGPNGAVNATAVDAQGDAGAYLRINFDDASVDRRVPKGESKTYRLRANSLATLSSTNTETVSINLRGDSAYPSLANQMGTVSAIEGTASTTDNIVWSPFSTTTPTDSSGINDNLDWTNGYGAPGFPSVGQDMTVRSFRD